MKFTMSLVHVQVNKVSCLPTFLGVTDSLKIPLPWNPPLFLIQMRSVKGLLRFLGATNVCFTLYSLRGFKSTRSWQIMLPVL